MAKILIVEDEKSLNEAYEMILKREKHDVRAAFNGKQGLELFKKDVPELVLLDLRMPEMDGVEFLDKLKPGENYPDTKIIVFSNYDDPEEIEKAFKRGAQHYVLKAWSSPSELVKIVNITLKSKAKKA